MTSADGPGKREAAIDSPGNLSIFAGLQSLLLATLVSASAQTPVTVMQLLQNPRYYVGRRVTVSGYYEGDWEGHHLFADRLERDRSINRGRFIYANRDADSPLRKALVIGVFVYNFQATGQAGGGGYGTFGGWKGALANATVHFPREPKASRTGAGVRASR